MKPKIYAMCGPIGSGKTTFATQLAKEKNAVLFLIDHSINQLGQPIHSAKDYEKYYFGVRDLITTTASQVLRLGMSVVFDFGGKEGHWDWLKPLADQTNATIEVHNFIVPIEVRRERVRKRNLDPNYFWQFSDEEFDSMPAESIPPKALDKSAIFEHRN